MQCRSACWLHPRYADIVRLLDAELMRVTLRPRPDDQKLETVQALLLCAHWMPFDVSDTGKRYRSRFSEMGAWQCLGLALSARRPSYLNPTPLKEVLDNFLHAEYVQTTDIRLASLFKVACGAHSTGCRPSTIESVEAFDKDVELIERQFLSSLGNRSIDALSQHFPFTSLRWYRLSYVCAFLDATDITQRTGEALTWAIDWASQILFHLSRPRYTRVSSDTPENIQLEPDPSVVDVMSFAIDHYFVVIAYASFVLVNSWLSNLMDFNLRPHIKQSDGALSERASTSLLFRLVDVAARTLEAASPPEGHLARRYVPLLRGMAGIISSSETQIHSSNCDNMSMATGTLDPSEQLQSNLGGDLWEMWQQAGLEPIIWPGPLDGVYDT
ncbi:unnamed protein product [Penicillium pancosmium]